MADDCGVVRRLNPEGLDALDVFVQAPASVDRLARRYKRECCFALGVQVARDVDDVGHHGVGIGEHGRVHILEEIALPIGRDEPGVVDVPRRMRLNGDDAACHGERSSRRLRVAHRVRMTTDALAPRPTVWPSPTRAPSTCRGPAVPRS